MMELGCSSVVAVLKHQFGQALADVPLVVANGLQGTTDVLTGLCVALALDQQRQLHDGRFQCQLIVVQTFEDVRQRVFRGGDGFDSVRGNRKRSRTNVS